MQGHNALRNWGLSILNIAQSGKEVNTSEKLFVRDSYEGLTDADFSENAEIYSYDFLTKQKPMQVVTVPSLANLEQGSNGFAQRADIIAEGRKNALHVGAAMANGHIQVKNLYTGRKLVITNSSIRHGLNGHAIHFLGNAQVAEKIGDLAKHAIPINALTPTDNNAVRTYVMAAMCRTTDGKEMIAILHIDQQSGAMTGFETLDLVHSTKGKQIKEKRLRPKILNQFHGDAADLIASLEISIADFLDKVNTFFPSILSDDVQERLHPDERAEGHSSPTAPAPPDTVSSERKSIAARQKKARLTVFHGKPSSISASALSPSGSRAAWFKSSDGG